MKHFMYNCCSLQRDFFDELYWVLAHFHNNELVILNIASRKAAFYTKIIRLKFDYSSTIQM